MSMNALTPPLGFRGSALRRLATFAAAALLATLIVAPVQAQTTGTITSVGDGLTFPSTATLNGNREWEITYSADFNLNIEQLVDVTCESDNSITDKALCPINPPYIMRYGVMRRAACFAQPPPWTIRGINGSLPFTSWTQTIRTDPDTEYCMAIYPGDSGHPYSKLPIASAWFKTPSDPNPPAPAAWTPAPQSLGCGAETTLALVRQCFQCKYGSGGSWSMSANTCSG